MVLRHLYIYRVLLVSLIQLLITVHDKDIETQLDMRAPTTGASYIDTNGTTLCLALTEVK
jgi:hypothetical protein